MDKAGDHQEGMFAGEKFAGTHCWELFHYMAKNERAHSARSCRDVNKTLG